MNKKIYLLPLLLLAVLFTSCEETKEAGKYDNWQARSEAFIDSIAGVYAAQTKDTPKEDSIYAFVDQYNLGQMIYVKKRKVEDESKLGAKPLYTSTVSAYYRGSFFTGEVFQETFQGADPEPFGTTAQFKVNVTIAGWTWPIQHMRVGERWMYYIPWQSAYGAGGQKDDRTGAVIIPGYTALVFDMKLNSIVAE